LTQEHRAQIAMPRFLSVVLSRTPSERTTPALVRRLTTLTLSYVVRNQRQDGTFFFRYRPAENILSGDSDLPRMAHAAWVLARAARAGERDIAAF
jgi:hypothetical protein